LETDPNYSWLASLRELLENRAHRGWQAQRALRGGKPVCCVNILPGAALTGPREAAPVFTRPCVTGDVLAEADVLFLRRLLV
jgi:hypothetical protein